MELTPDIASRFARIALGHVVREYPNKLDHVMESDADADTPRALHPAFFGSYDWHSCVHSWWLLLTIRREFPSIPEAAEIEALADRTFTEANLQAELAYLQRPASSGFERPYGWAWLLYLDLEAMRHRDKPWSAWIRPLAEVIESRFGDYLGVLTYPITVGTHFNTSFALALASEWSNELTRPGLYRAIEAWTLATFSDRRDYRGWEPGGDEFLSPVLSAANLMSWHVEEAEFRDWFADLVLANGWLERECHPVTVSDRSDGKIAHLDGLNFSRAWCLYQIAGPFRDRPEQALLLQRADTHLEAALPHVAGDYMGEHWLASFALLALLERRLATA